MDAREKLVELIRKGARGHTFMPTETIANYLVENGVTVQEWISIKDRLPENDYGKHWKDRKYYIVRYAPSGLMCVAHYGYKEYDWWIDNHDCVMSATNFKEVTHWMPLPEPPKGE